MVRIMVVRMRATRGHRNNRRSHHALDALRITVDGKSNVPHLRHRANLITGQYRGKQVLNVETKLKRKTKAKVETK